MAATGVSDVVVWGHDAPAKAVLAIADRLRRDGVGVNARRGPAGVQIMLLSRVDDGGLDVVRGASACDGRLVVVHVSPPALRHTDAWQLMAAGADDVIRWDAPGSVGQMVAGIERWRTIERMLRSPALRDRIVGSSAAFRGLLRELLGVAHFTDASVLITGETGTGKELLSQLVHQVDRRSHKGDLVVLDCTTVVPTLSGSEFFGHERGAFTGAVAARAGAFELADGGTLFLDEVGELALPLQAELLRVLQEGTYKRVGGNRWQTTAFRLVCATNRDLADRVRRGRFRGDLYHRIAASHFAVPPLRQRRDDIVELAQHFLARRHPQLADPPFDAAVEVFLRGRDYPGNVRELAQLVDRIASRHAGPGVITVGDVPSADRPVGLASRRWPDAHLTESLRMAYATDHSLRDVKEAARDELLRIALAEAREGPRNGVVQRAAGRLGVSVRMVQTWLREHERPGDAIDEALRPDGR